MIIYIWPPKICRIVGKRYLDVLLAVEMFRIVIMVFVMIDGLELDVEGVGEGVNFLGTKSEARRTISPNSLMGR